MTDQTPEPRPIIIDLSPDPETIRCINEGIQRIKEQFARMRFRNTACAALTACLDGDDDRAARHLAGLDDAALYAIEGAGSALAIHASRLRKDPDEEPDDESVCDEPTCICHDLAPNDEPDEQDGASATLEAIDEITGLDHLAPWERDLLAAKAADEQPVTDLDLPALNAAISDAYARWHEPGVYPDPAGMLAAVREAIDPTLFGLRDRARRAEADTLTALTAARDQRHRAEAAERERDAAVGRAVAGALEQAKTEADERVAFVERQRAAWEADAKRHLGNADYWRQRAETAEQRASRLADQLAERRRQHSAQRQRAVQAEEALRTEQHRAEEAEREQRRLATERDEAHRRAETLRASRDEIRKKLDEARGYGEETVRQLNKAERERDRERRRAESAEAQDARHIRYLNDARDAADAADWPSIPTAIRALRNRAEQAEKPLDVDRPAGLTDSDIRRELRAAARRGAPWLRRFIQDEARHGNPLDH